MGTLFNDVEAEVIYLKLNKADGSGTDDYYFSDYYWASGDLYSSAPEVWPLLARSPESTRGMGTFVANRYDTTIELFGNMVVGDKEKRLIDILEGWKSSTANYRSEPHNSAVEIRYYTRPRGSGASVSHATANIRQTLTLIDYSFDASTGLVQLECRDTWPKDKELGRRLSDSILTDLDPEMEGEFGAFAFGQSTVAGEGVLVDGALYDQYSSSGALGASIFAGWVPLGHDYEDMSRLMVRNQHREVGGDEWVEMETSPTNIGTTGLLSVSDPTNWPVDLSRYSRAYVHTPSSKAEILGAVQCQLKVPTNERCADVVGGQYFFPDTEDQWSYGDTDFTVNYWVNFDVLSNGGSNSLQCAQGHNSSNLEWFGYFAAGNNAPKFSISSDGTTATTTATWGSSLSTGTWYMITYTHDSTNNRIGIQVNAGTAVTTNYSGGGEPVKREGRGHIGCGFAGIGLDGKIMKWGFWRRLLTGTEITNLYNSGTAVNFDAIADTYQNDLISWYELDEVQDEFRQDSKGRGFLRATNYSAAGDSVINYAYATNTSISLNSTYGDLTLSIYPCQTVDGGATYQPIGNALRTVSIDPSDSNLASGTDDAYFFIDPPLVELPGVSYMHILDWSNSKTNKYFVTCGYLSTSGKNHYALDKRREGSGWAKQTDVELMMKLWFHTAGFYTSEVVPPAANDRAHATFGINTGTIEAGTTPPSVRGVEFKTGVKALVDDVSGTYTGSAFSIIEKPSDILLFLLRDDDFGMGLASGSVESSSFTDIRAVNGNLKAQVVIDRSISAYELIQELCRQGRMRLYKTRDGKMAINWPTTISSPAGLTANISEGGLRADLTIKTVRDNDYSTIINDVKQVYAPDKLNVPKDPSITRKAETDKYSGLVYLNGTEDSGGSGTRSTQAAASIALYGRRDHRGNLDFYDSSTPAQIVSYYYFDRYNQLQKRVVCQVLRKVFYNSIDLFSKVAIQHTAIPNRNGTADFIRTAYDGTPIVIYYEGTPIVGMAEGVVMGEVMEIRESGPYMELIIETVPSFAN